MKLARLSIIPLAVAIFAALTFVAPNQARSATYVTPGYSTSATYVHYYPTRRYHRHYHRPYYRSHRYYRSYPYYGYYPYTYYPSYPLIWPGFSFQFVF
jgi:hypothetical protein